MKKALQNRKKFKANVKMKNDSPFINLQEYLNLPAKLFSLIPPSIAPKSKIVQYLKIGRLLL